MILDKYTLCLDLDFPCQNWFTSCWLCVTRFRWLLNCSCTENLITIIFQFLFPWLRWKAHTCCLGCCHMRRTIPIGTTTRVIEKNARKSEIGIFYAGSPACRPVALNGREHLHCLNSAGSNDQDEGCQNQNDLNHLCRTSSSKRAAPHFSFEASWHERASCLLHDLQSPKVLQNSDLKKYPFDKHVVGSWMSHVMSSRHITCKSKIQFTIAL